MSWGDIQASVRAVTGTALDYDGDWDALFDLAGIPAAEDWNGRMLSWINRRLGASYPDVEGAMQAFAVANGAWDWASLGGFNAGGGALAPKASPLVAGLGLAFSGAF